MIPAIYPQQTPKAILFDWDNTLVDTWRTIYEALNVSLAAVDRSPITLDEFWARPHQSMRDSAVELFGDHIEVGEKAFYAHIENFHLETIQVLKGADILLESLKSREIYLGVVSNKDGHHLRKEVAHLGWNSHFRRIIGARDTEEDKPSHLPVLAALEKSMILPSHDVWFVGDSIIDVQCARKSGCVPIVVGQGEASQQDDIVYAKDCSGLMEILAKL